MFKKQLIVIIILLLLSLPSVWSLLSTPGYFLSDDGEWMVIRFSAFYQEVLNGQFPPRFFGRLNHSYGYPVGNFLYPGFMYLATPIKFLGFGFADSVKILIVSSVLISGCGAYLWLNRRFSKGASLIGAMAYVYFPYHLFDVYVRGSVGEILGLAILPFLLLFVDRSQIIVSGILYGFLILSHNSLALLFTPIIILYTLLLKKRNRLLFLPLGLLLSAFFWIPALLEIHYTNFSKITVSLVSDYFVTNKNISLIGFVGVTTLILSVGALFKKKDQVVLFFSLLFLASLFFATPLSLVFWDVIPFKGLIQFPWRLLSITLVSTSFLISFFIDQSKNIQKHILMLVFSLVIIISAVPYLEEFKPIEREEGYYFTNEDSTTVANEYMPVWVRQTPEKRPQSVVEVVKGKGQLTVTHETTSSIAFQADMVSPSIVQINKLYYPGFEILVNDKKHEVFYKNNYGQMQISLPAGEYSITVQFKETLMRFFANAISILTLCGVLISALLSDTIKKLIQKRIA